MNIINRSSNSTQLLSFIYEIRYILLFYVIGDFFTTMHALRYGFEENGILAAVMQQYGIWSLMILKILFLLLVYYNYSNIKTSKSKWLHFLWVLSKKGIVLVGMFLVVNNILVSCGSYSLIQIIKMTNIELII